jgi:hypothetical protein
MRKTNEEISVMSVDELEKELAAGAAVIASDPRLDGRFWPGIDDYMRSMQIQLANLVFDQKLAEERTKIVPHTPRITGFYNPTYVSPIYTYQHYYFETDHPEAFKIGATYCVKATEGQLEPRTGTFTVRAVSDNNVFTDERDLFRVIPAIAVGDYIYEVTK